MAPLSKKVQNGTITTYNYDGLDRLIQVHQGDNHTTYQYDAFNRRISKTHNGITTHYLYQEQNEIGAYINNTPTELRILGIGHGAEIGAAIILELSQTYIPTHDQNGNVSALFIPSGECVETYRYTAFGEEQNFSILNPWRFSSKRYDSETGFLYFGQRYYAPDLGRWITPDPLDYEDGPNLYAYVHNNPLTSVDLYGLFDDNNNFSFLREWGENSITGCTQSLQDFCNGFQSGFSSNAELPPPSTICSVASQGFSAISRAYKSITTGEKIFASQRITQFAQKGELCLDKLSKAGQIMDRGSLTKAGRALEKHGSRLNSVFPNATGNIANKNMQGQYHLEDILTHPQYTVKHHFYQDKEILLMLRFQEIKV